VITRISKMTQSQRHPISLGWTSVHPISLGWTSVIPVLWAGRQTSQSPGLDVSQRIKKLSASIADQII